MAVVFLEDFQQLSKGIYKFDDSLLSLRNSSMDPPNTACRSYANMSFKNIDSKGERERDSILKIKLKF